MFSITPGIQTIDNNLSELSADASVSFLFFSMFFPAVSQRPSVEIFIFHLFIFDS